MAASAKVSPSEKPEIDATEALELLQCPVCFNYMVPPIFQCPGGHAICKDCVGKVDNCPSCRSFPLNIKCLALAKLIDTLGEIPCKYRDAGCSESLPYKAWRDHEMLCPRRSFKCVELNCDFEGLASDLVAHLVSFHKYTVHQQTNTISYTCEPSHARRINGTAPAGRAFWLWQNQIFSCYEKNFLLRISARQEGPEPTISICLVGLDGHHHSHRYRIEAVGNHRRFIFEGPVWSVSKGVREPERVRDCLILPENIALFLSGCKGSEGNLELLKLNVRGEVFSPLAG